MKHDYDGHEYEGEDFYCYPNTKVLVNIYNIRDYEKLQEAESGLSFAKMVQLQEKPIKGEFNLEYLQKIHKVIFEEIYTWAGRIRGGKFFSKGQTQFCNAEMIPSYAEDIFSKLRKENNLVGLTRNEFIERIAFYVGEINALHPFREGNGRTQRIFFEELARRAGFELNFKNAEKEEILNADIEAYNQNYNPLIELLDKKILSE